VGHRGIAPDEARVGVGADLFDHSYTLR
jgi:hypothetical protein